MIKIKLNKNFYPEKAVKATINAYIDICDADLGGIEGCEDYEGKDFEIILIPKKPIDEEKLKHEFCNYCLSQVKG